MVFELSKTVSEQREKLDSKFFDTSMTSFDSKMNDSRILSRKSKNGETSFHHEGDVETIEELKDDIGQLLKEYKIVERQKEDYYGKYHKQVDLNTGLMKDISSMEVVITDQNEQIKNMREKLRGQFDEHKRNEILARNIGRLRNLNAGDETMTEDQRALNASANISKQVDMEDLNKIDADRLDYEDHIDEEVINDALNLSYQVLNTGFGTKENQNLISRSRNKKNSGSTEDDSQQRSWGKRIFGSIGKKNICAK